MERRSFELFYKNKLVYACAVAEGIGHQLRMWGTEIQVSALPHLRHSFLASLLLMQEMEGFFFLGTLHRATLHTF